MTVQIKVPTMGESVTEGVIAKWLKSEGDPVDIDEPVVEVETDKVTVEVPAPTRGVLAKQRVGQGTTVAVGDIVGDIDDSAAAKASSQPRTARARSADGEPTTAAPAVSGPAMAEGAMPVAESEREPADDRHGLGEVVAMPSARAEARRRGISLEEVEGSGRGGRIVKEDVIRSAAARGVEPTTATGESTTRRDREERKPMSPLRRRVAERLVEAQQTAAILTTFNEVDMSAVVALRKRHGDAFQKRHGVKLGFMSFFVKGSVEALKSFPAVNAEIRGDEILYKYHYDIGVAVGGGKGLVVPVVRDVDSKSFADIERQIADYGERARQNRLQISDLTGGTFTISNGGVYGSMLSTPILNPPQTGILGLHKIQERPVAIEGRVEIRPMMYLALSYDHRLVDGREAVQFLVHIKQLIEDPERILLEL